MVNDHRQKSGFALRRPFWSLAGLIDQGFFLLAGGLSFWLAWLVWREGWNTGGWWMVGLFVVVWMVTAYLALPRLHRILSSLYVPNYFIGRTRTADGLLGDPVNLALRGSEEQLHTAMTAAGWTLADDVTLRSAWRIIISILMRRSYKHAPVSSLFLFGRRQDFTYQQEIDGNPGKRHHVRFWRCPHGWLLPGGHRVDWLAAGTYDKSVGISLFTLQITHKIDENTDIERDYILDTVTEAMPGIKVTNLKDFSTGYHSRSGGGDMIKTDGDLPVLELGATDAGESPAIRPGIILDATSHEKGYATRDNLIWRLWSRRPPQISFGVLLVGFSMLIGFISTVVDFVGMEQLRQQITTELQKDNAVVSEVEVTTDWIINSSIVAFLVWAVVTIFLVRKVFYGSNRARIGSMIIITVVTLASSFSLTIGKITWSTIGLLLFIGVNITILLLFSSDSAQRFTLARSQGNKIKKQEVHTEKELT